MIVKTLLLVLGIILLVEKYGVPSCEARGIESVKDGTIIKISGPSSELPNSMEDIIAAARSRRTRKQRQTRTKRYSHNSRIRQRTRFRVGTTTTTFAPISVDPVINDLEDPVILPDESVVPVLPLILLNDSSTTEHVPLSTQISVIVEISEVLNNKIQNPIENEQVDHVTPQLAESTTEKNSQEENTEVESTNIPILGDEPIKIDLELQEYGNSTEIQETTKEPIISNPINFTLPSITEKLEIVLKIENASVSEDLEATTVKLESVTTTERAQTTQSVIVSNEESSSEVKPYEPSSAEIDKILNLELIKQEYPDPGDYNKLPNHPTTFKVPINIQPDSKITPVKGPVIEKVVTTKAPDIIQESSGDYNKLPNSDITVAEESSDSSEEVNSLERDPEEPDEPEEPTDNDLISNTQMSQEDTKYGNNPEYYMQFTAKNHTDLSITLKVNINDNKKVLTTPSPIYYIVLGSKEEADEEYDDAREYDREDDYYEIDDNEYD